MPTTKQVPNPTGKGGFREHPELRSNGSWKKEDTLSWCYREFKAMKYSELKAWKDKNPDCTVVQMLAYTRVLQAYNDLRSLQEVTNRTEGMPVQPTDITSGGDKIELLHIYKPEQDL